MKKIAAAILVTVLSLFGYAAVSAYGAPQYLEGLYEYIIVAEQPQSGTAWYLDRSSVSAYQTDDSEYYISVDICRVPRAAQGATDIDNRVTNEFLYDTDAGEMYTKNSSGDWVYIAPDAPRATALVSKPAGEMAFYVAFGSPFYNCFPGSFYDIT